MDKLMMHIAFDLGLLAAASSVGIYVATARLALIGWLLQYKYPPAGAQTPLKKRAFVKSQVSKLSWFVFASFGSATLALSAIGARVLDKHYIAEWIEVCLVSLWLLIMGLFLVFHIWIECVHSGKLAPPTVWPPPKK